MFGDPWSYQKTQATKQKGQLTAAIFLIILGRENNILDWDEAKIIGTRGNKHNCCIKVHAPSTVNQTEGAFLLSYTCDDVEEAGLQRWHCSLCSAVPKSFYMR